MSARQRFGEICWAIMLAISCAVFIASIGLLLVVATPLGIALVLFALLGIGALWGML